VAWLTRQAGLFRKRPGGLRPKPHQIISTHEYHAIIDGTDARHLACMHSSTDVSLVSTNQTNAFYRLGFVKYHYKKSILHSSSIIFIKVSDMINHAFLFLLSALIPCNGFKQRLLISFLYENIILIGVLLRDHHFL
jgi:hypothetical protein